MSVRCSFPGPKSWRSLAQAASLIAAIIAPSGAQAQDAPAIGISAPMSGYFAILGEQVETGARAAIGDGGDVTLQVFDDACDAEGGARTADAMIAAKVSIAIGFPCIEAFDAAMPKLAEAGIPVILLGVQAEGITEEREKNGWKLLRLAPRNSDEADAIAGYLATAWRSVNFGIIDDGTLYGRQLAEAVRFALENDNLKPVFTDTYRPQLQNQISLVRRLRKAGAAYVFIGGDAFDAAIIGKDANAVDVPLTLAGGSALIAPPTDGTLADGTLLAALPDWLDREPARGLAKKLEKNPVAGDGYVVPAHAAVEIALTGMAARDDSGHVAIEPLIGKTFDTALGPVRFDENGDLIRNLYEVFIVRDGRFEPVDSDSNTGAIR